VRERRDCKFSHVAIFAASEYPHLVSSEMGAGPFAERIPYLRALQTQPRSYKISGASGEITSIRRQLPLMESPVEMMPVGDGLECFKADSTALSRVGRYARAQLEPHLVSPPKSKASIPVTSKTAFGHV
jgi:hypothetical protein